MKRWLLLLTLLLITLPLAVTAQESEGVSLEDFELAERIQAKIDAGETLNIYVSYHDVSNEFAPFIRAGVERAVEELGVNAQFIGPVGADADAQISEIETLLDEIDGLAISSVSTDALAPLINRVIEAGIPVVTFNTDNPDSDRLVFAGQDLVQSGREAGELMAEYLNGEGQVIITTLDAAAQWSIDRESGAREALANYPGIEVVQTVNTGTDPQEIYAAIENAMLANPDVTGILSLECCSTPAAGEWVTRNDAVGTVTVVGFDLLDDTVQLVADGAIQATIDQAPERQGFEAVNLLVRFLNGETISNLDTGVGIYTQDNIDEVLNPTTEAEGVSLADFALAERIQAKIDAGETLNIYVSYHDVSNEFAPFIRAGVERAVEELGVNAQFIGPVGADADAQISEIETLLDEIDGLAISSVSTDALAPLINRVIEAGIPVVTFNTDNPDSNRLAFAGQDLVQSGREAGELMAEYLNGEGQVIITTLDAAAQWSIDRESGAREALANYPGIEVVQTVNTGTDPQEIYAAIENAMLANPDVTGILSLECCSTPAAGEWVTRNDAVGTVTVVGFDLLDDTVQLVADGAIQATIDQAPERQGFEAVNLLVRFLNGETISNLDTGVGIYTQENIAEVAGS
ncbi:MAG: substrate-binding domain-containing protein [bacterium]|nr:substrate-binding domain-containing protein [bacterium]